VKLESLHLKNFRTYEDLTVSFDKRLTFITGRNASGKTNLLEAVSLLSLGKSFRGSSDQDMIARNSDHYHIASRYLRGESTYKLEMGCSLAGNALKRRIKLNDKQLGGRSALIGNLITVIFSPADIAIVEGGPAERRRFLDIALSSHDPEYLRVLMQYNRALKQRNAVLKRIKKNDSTPADLAPWDLNLSSLAEILIRTRSRFVSDFQDIFRSSLERISGSQDDITLGLSLSAEGEADDFRSVLERYQRRDTIMGFTTIGPHRHNLSFETEGRDIMSFGSQGQKRSLVLALRVAQFYYLTDRLKLSPILLIDDVIRELDSARRGAFVELLHECGQAIFTTPDMDGLERLIGDLGEQIGLYTITEPGALEVASPAI